MSRGFFGGGGAGGDKRDLTKKKSLMASLAMSRKAQKTMGEMIRERATHKQKDYKEMVEDLLDDKIFSTAAKPDYFHLPGTLPNEEKTISKGKQLAIEHFKMKRMKEKMKTRDQKVDVVPKHYNGRAGGWIDRKGKIRNKDGLVVMEVNLKNGIITNRLGMKIGKYNAFSYSNDFKIQRLIDKYTHEQKNLNPFAIAKKKNPLDPFSAD